MIFTVLYVSLLGVSVALHFTALANVLLVLGLSLVGMLFASMVAVAFYLVSKFILSVRLAYNLKRMGYIHDEPSINPSSYFPFEFLETDSISYPTKLESRLMILFHSLRSRKISKLQSDTPNLININEKTLIRSEYSKHLLAKKAYESFLYASTQQGFLERNARHPYAAYIFVSSLEPTIPGENHERSLFFYKNHYHPEDQFSFREIPLDQLNAMDGLPVSWAKEILLAK